MHTQYDPAKVLVTFTPKPKHPRPSKVERLMARAHAVASTGLDCYRNALRAHGQLLTR